MPALIWEVIHMGAFILVASYCLHLLAFKKGLGDKDFMVKSAAKDNDVDTELDEDSSGSFNPLVKKWFELGGGYYGVVALVKLIQIEFVQLKNFLLEWRERSNFFDDLGPQLLISFFVQQFESFVSAISWPAYYVSAFPILHCAIFVFFTYLLYEWSRQLARDSFVRSKAI